MKTTLVKIDRESIKKNSNAGQRSFTTIGYPEIRFKAVNLPKELPNDMLVSSIELINDKYHYEGIITSPQWEERQKSFNLEIEINRNFQRFYHEPIPPYNYSYENIDLKCNNCKSKIKLFDLISDMVDEDGNEYYSDEVCPICRTFNCLDMKLEYEKFDKKMVK